MDKKNIHPEGEGVGTPSQGSGDSLRSSGEPEGSFLPFETAVQYVGNLLSELRAAKVNGRATLTFTSHEIQSLAQAHRSLKRAVNCHDELVAACELALTAFQPWGTEHPAEAALKAILAKARRASK